MIMLLCEGSPYYTAFRKTSVLNVLQQINDDIVELHAQYLYRVYAQALSTKDEQEVASLLRATTITDPLCDNKSWQFMVVPRLGTVSPWSSKATDIAHCCRLPTIDRIETSVLYHIHSRKPLDSNTQQAALKALHDPLTETIIMDLKELDEKHEETERNPSIIIDVLNKGKEELESANDTMGLALSPQEIDYLFENSLRLKKNPTDTELMMFSQVNSEHCRHKIFNANWTIDDRPQAYTLFQMIRNTMKQHPNDVKVAYDDNAAVLGGSLAHWFIPDNSSQHYAHHEEPSNIVLKVETHNHPTAISPFAGAATGSGGEIRDEAATGRGAYSKAGLCGFATSHLNLPNLPQPWELDIGKPPHLATAFEIMRDGPIGAASFNNEFGRPNISGFFRTFEIQLSREVGDVVRSYYKPMMVAGGIGAIRDSQIEKKALPVGAKLIVLGGPAMMIGLGGGSASSRSNTDDQYALDFASVQRSNPQMQRRAQEVINRCWMMGEDNPILSLHDVGAGGLSNAMPEIIHTDNRGGQFDLTAIPNAQPDMSPMEIWCNEAQERFVLAINPEDVSMFQQICEREQCPFAVIGTVTKKSQLELHDKEKEEDAIIDIPMSVLFEDMPPLNCSMHRAELQRFPFDTKELDLDDAITRVLQFPCVADKSFLITIADRSVGGLVVRDPMVGPWQVPVADVAVTCSDFQNHAGEAFSMGERSPIALLHPAASARMAIGEALTNLAAAPIKQLSDISLSANWMGACDYSTDAIGLYDAVQAVGMEMCPALGINIPVGKDSLSMRVDWQQNNETSTVASPLSLVVTAAAPVADVTQTLTPQLSSDKNTTLIFLDLAKGSQCLGGSVLAQVYQQLGQRPADVTFPETLKIFFEAMQELKDKKLILAYHDRSDGGLITTLAEMAFASHCGLDIDTSSLGEDVFSTLFNEELGVVLQISKSNVVRVQAILKNHQLLSYCHILGSPTDNETIKITHNGETIYSNSRITLHRLWSETSYNMQALRDNADCAKQEYDNLLNHEDPGLHAVISFNAEDDITAPYLNLSRPKIAILREQGVNGHVEMAAAFDRAGFDCFDVHMTDLLHGRHQLSEYSGLAACGGFSYGDVLGAGRGWAQSILRNSQLRDMFTDFFERENTFTLGVCNGCQMLSQLQALIPGSLHWPTWQRNQSEQFEARLSLVQIPSSPSILLAGMAGSVLPIAVAHAEGQATFSGSTDHKHIDDRVCLQYVDHSHQTTQRYPFNPNGSMAGIAGVTSSDGRVTLMMPHPERVFRTVQHSWAPKDWQSDAPWLRLFRNANAWLK